MDSAMNSSVADIIQKYKKVGEILHRYDIGCVDCSAATCSLQDVVEIHNLERSRAEDLIAEIADAMDLPPGQLQFEPAGGADGGERELSPVMRIMMDEHDLILRLVEVIPTLVLRIDPTTEDDQRRVSGIVRFIRQFADRLHHEKEEDTVFCLFDQDIEIFQVMRRDHEVARETAGALDEAAEKRDRGSVVTNLLRYAELLEEHIEKENEILYPWIDRQLTDRQVGELYSEFRRLEDENAEFRREEEEFLDELEVYADGCQDERQVAQATAN